MAIPLTEGALKVERGLKFYRRGAPRERVISFLGKSVDLLPSRHELASLDQFRHIGLLQITEWGTTIAGLYRSVAIDYVRNIYPKFNAERIGDGSKSSKVYDKFHNMIDRVPKEDIALAVSKCSSPEVKSVNIHQVSGPENTPPPTFTELVDPEAYGRLGRLLYSQGINFVSQNSPVTVKVFLRGYDGVVIRYDRKTGQPLHFYPLAEEKQLREFIGQRRQAF